MLVRQRTRAALQAAALFYVVDRGWPVLPGAYVEDDGRCSCGDAECPDPGAHPAAEPGLTRATRSTDDVWEWWSGKPYTVLLASGLEFDVLDAPAAVGYAAIRQLELLGLPSGPVLHLPGERLLFLVNPGARNLYWYTVDHNDRARFDVRHHAVGHFVPAPPSSTACGGLTRWAVPPDPIERGLPGAVDVLGALIRFSTQASRTWP
jgi:hypothetical protein